MMIYDFIIGKGYEGGKQGGAGERRRGTDQDVEVYIEGSVFPEDFKHTRDFPHRQEQKE